MLQKQIILASGSPRRFELLSSIGFEPWVRKSKVAEERGEDEAPSAYATRLALEKATDVRLSLTDTDPDGAWILAADTIVEFEGRVLEKPKDEAEAFEMLTSLSGHWHRVITAYAWVSRDGSVATAEAVITRVLFRPNTAETITRYIASGEPMDKAGSYGIQGLGAILVEKIEGSYSCVVGLPLSHVVDTLRSVGGLDEFPFLGPQ